MIRVRFELTPSFEDQELLVKVTLTWRLGPLGHLTMLLVEGLSLNCLQGASHHELHPYPNLILYVHL